MSDIDSLFVIMHRGYRASMVALSAVRSDPLEKKAFTIGYFSSLQEPGESEIGQTAAHLLLQGYVWWRKLARSKRCSRSAGLHAFDVKSSDVCRTIDHRLASARAAQKGLEPTVAYFALASANSTADVVKRKFKERLTLASPSWFGCWPWRCSPGPQDPTH